MSRSLARGDYRLLAWVESPSHEGQWYRVLADNRPPHALSCDCPIWVFGRQKQDGVRVCKHTLWVSGQAGRQPSPAAAAAALRRLPDSDSPLVAAARRQNPQLGMLVAKWHAEEGSAWLGDHRYYLVLLQALTQRGLIGTGLIALADHYRNPFAVQAEVAVRAGWAVTCDLIQQGGYPGGEIGQPPSYFKATGGNGAHGERAGTGIGFADILRLSEVDDLGDGLTPAQRAENTLRLCLGDGVYRQLTRQGYLDVPSYLYAANQRVYRVRRDPDRRRVRRVRVFERGSYVHDFCIVPAATVPEADHWLTVFLGLVADESAVLAVVKPTNVFSPYSDGQERETAAARWEARTASAA